MEQSAFEAVMIGVNVFVFIMALTAGVLLMSNIIDMVNFANDQAIIGMNGTLAENVGEVTERTYTGVQMLKYCEEKLKADETELDETRQQVEGPYIFKIKLSESGQEDELQDYIKANKVSEYLSQKFKLEYKGLEREKYVYVFSRVNE